MSKFKFKVNIIESEAGWGQKLDDVKEFDTYDEAEKFIKEHNSENNKAKVPPIYWRAERGNYEAKK